MAQYPLKYRRFDQLLSDASIDLTNYSLENMIEPQTLIKVAQSCNYRLGLRIYKTQQSLLTIEHGNVRLPDDFYVFNYGLLCDKRTVTSVRPQGLHLEHVVPTYKSLPETVNTCTDGSVCSTCNVPVNDCGCPTETCPVTSPCENLTYNPLEPYGDACIKPRVFVNCKNECVEIIQIINAETHTYENVMPVRLRNNGANIDTDCPNLYMKAANEVWIKDGFLYASFDCGKIYLSYQGDMEDEEGNVLVPDHPGLNDYYEYSIKEKILENLMMNDEDVVRKLQYIQQKLQMAKREAMSIVNTPDFEEMKQVWKMNRAAQYKKYYRQFQAQPWFSNNHLGLY